MVETPYLNTCSKCGVEFLAERRRDKMCQKCKNFYKNGVGYSKLFYKNRKIVFERDESKCQCCGLDKQNRMKTNSLIVHHLDCDRGNNSLSNLITLCTQCHLSLHGKYTKYTLRRSNIYKLFANEKKFGEFGKNLIYGASKQIVKKQFGGKPKLFFKKKNHILQR